MSGRAWVVVLLLAGCGGDKGRSPEEPAATAPADDDSTREGDHPAPPDGGVYDFERCVKDCVRERQMQAIPIEKIEADCQGVCASDSD